MPETLDIAGPAILIDDTYSEVEPVILQLNKLGILHAYFDGATPPQSPLNGIRIAFLDIQLHPGVSDSDGKIAVGVLVNAVSNVISKNTGPLYVVFWTKHGELANKAILALISSGYTIAGYTCKTKPTAGDTTSIEEVFRSINTSIKSKTGLLPLLLWEEGIRNTAGRFVGELHSWFSSQNPADETIDLSQPLLLMYRKLLHAYCGGSDNIPPETPRQWECVRHQMNDLFSGSVTNSASNFPTNLKLATIPSTSTGLPADKLAMINTALTISIAGDHTTSFGSVHKFVDEQLLASMLSFSKIRQQGNSNFELCAAVITPQCDLAVKTKMLRSTWGQCDSFFHRIVYGLIWEIDDPSKPTIYTEKERQSDYRFLKPIYFNQKAHGIWFNFASISSILDCKLPAPLFLLKPQVAMDLQSKAAIHVNRLGISQVA